MNKKSDLFKIKIGKYQNNIKSNTNVTLCDDHTVTIKYMWHILRCCSKVQKKRNKKKQEKRREEGFGGFLF